MFELKTPTKAKLKKTDDKGIKLGQKDHRDAVKVRLEVHLPNSALEMFDPALRGILYGKGSPGEKAMRQAKVEGLEEPIELPSLTRTGLNLMTLNWGEEQTGCGMVIDYGTGEKSNLALKDGTTKDFKISLQEGGSVKIAFSFHAPSDHLSDEQLGRLHRLHQRSVTVTLSGPAVDAQRAIEEGSEPPVPRGNTVTPLKALKNATEKGEREPATA